MATNTNPHGNQMQASSNPPPTYKRSPITHAYIKWLPVAMVNQSFGHHSTKGDTENHRKLWRPFKSAKKGNYESNLKLNTAEKEDSKKVDTERKQVLLDHALYESWHQNPTQPPRETHWSEDLEIPNPPPPSPQPHVYKRQRKAHSSQMIPQPKQEETATFKWPTDDKTQIMKSQRGGVRVAKREYQDNDLMSNHSEDHNPLQARLEQNRDGIICQNWDTEELDIPQKTCYGDGQEIDLRDKLIRSRHSNGKHNKQYWRNKKGQKKLHCMKHRRNRQQQNRWKKNKQTLNQVTTTQIHQFPNHKYSTYWLVPSTEDRSKTLQIINLPLAPSINMLGGPDFTYQPNQEHELMTGTFYPSQPSPLEIETRMAALQIDPQETQSKGAQMNKLMTRTFPPNQPIHQQIETNTTLLQTDPQEKQNMSSNMAQSNNLMTGKFFPQTEPQMLRNETNPLKTRAQSHNATSTPTEKGKLKSTNKPSTHGTHSDTKLNTDPQTAHQKENLSTHVKQNEMLQGHNQVTPTKTQPKAPHPDEVRKQFTSTNKVSLGKIDLLINRYQTIFDNLNNMTTLAQIHKDKPFLPQIQEVITENQSNMTELLNEIKTLSEKAIMFEEESYITIPKFGEEDKIDMKIMDTLPTFYPKDPSTTLHHFWQKISIYVETFGLTEKATKLILQFRLQGEAFDTFEMIKERPIKEIIFSLKESFGGFPTKTDFEEQMNRFKRGKNESIKSAMNRYEYIIAQLYKDQHELDALKERKCKEMVKKIAMREAWEHLERAETTSNGVDLSYQDRLKLLSREEDIIKKRNYPEINSLNTPYPNYDNQVFSEEEYDSESEEYNTDDENSHDEIPHPIQASKQENNGYAINSLNNQAGEADHIHPEETGQHQNDECLNGFNDLAPPPEPTYNDLLQENACLREEIAATRASLEKEIEDLKLGAQYPTDPSLSLLVDEYDMLRKSRELEEQQPPKFIMLEDEIFERKPMENYQPEDGTEEFPEEDYVDECDYDPEDYLDEPVPNEAVINSLLVENARLKREIHLSEVLQRPPNGV